MPGERSAQHRRSGSWHRASLLGGALAWAAAVAPAAAHDIGAHLLDRRIDAPSVTVEFVLSAGPSAGLAKYQVFAPGEQVPFQEGKTDRLGRVAFLPDRPGTWRIEVPDYQGYAASSSIEVSEAQAAPTEPAWRRWLLRGSLLANIVLVVVFALGLSRRRRPPAAHVHRHPHDHGHEHGEGHGHAPGPGHDHGHGHGLDHRPDPGAASAASS